MRQKSQGIHPKGPHGAQRRREQAKKQYGTAQRPQQHVSPQQAGGAPQGKEKQRRTDAQGVYHVQQRSGAGQPQAHRPDEIIEHGGAQAQQHRLAEQSQLLGDLDLHRRLPQKPAEKPP